MVEYLLFTYLLSKSPILYFFLYLFTQLIFFLALIFDPLTLSLTSLLPDLASVRWASSKPADRLFVLFPVKAE